MSYYQHRNRLVETLTYTRRVRYAASAPANPRSNLSASEPLAARGGLFRGRCRRAACLAIVGGGVQMAAAQTSRVTDESVDSAISRGIEWLKSQRNDKHWEGQQAEGQAMYGGDTSLALLAMLYCGENARRQDMAESLAWLADQPLTAVYTYGVRAHALALVPGRRYHKQLKKDVEWLRRAIYRRGGEGAGGYGYSLSDSGQGATDNSNSQYGVLGAWMASDAGIPIPEDYWLLVKEHWLRVQQANGGWAYRDGGQSTGSMTAAGLATAYVVLEKAYARDEGSFNGTSSPLCGEHRNAQDVLAAIDRGLDWFGTNFKVDENPGGASQWLYYYLYGVERIGRASGRKSFRGEDWFRAGAEFLLRSQQPNGAWPSSELRNTCFSLMFLAHGRAPLLMNKLQHGDDWNNKIRDVAGLTRYCEKHFERLLNWQVITLDAPIEDLLEAPITYMAGHTAWEFTDEEVDKLREYCQRGGMLLGVPCCSRDEFAAGFKKLSARMFPQFPLKPVGPEHPIINGEVQHTLTKTPQMLEAHNGVRTLIFMPTKDICAPWNQGRSVGRWEQYFHLGANMYLYATDKTRVRSRLETPYIPHKQVSTRRTVKVARIQYDGPWDPEPYGWKRLVTYMNNEAATRLEVSSGVRLDAGELKNYKIAHITGSKPISLNAAELKGLRAFIVGGGTLLIDSAGGSREFSQSIEKYVSKVIKRNTRYLQKDSFFLHGKGIPDAVSLDRISYRRTARSSARGSSLPRIRAHQSRSRLEVIFSPLDLSAGLLGTHIYNCRGYSSESALRIMRNMLLYANMKSRDKSRLSRAQRRGN